MTRLALIHALAHSVAPINAVLAEQWPEAQRMNLLDDSLSADLARQAAGGAPGLDGAMFARFETLAQYAVDCGADAILFTCSAFGPCIEAVAARRPQMPVLKPNEAMLAESAELPGPLGLVASFGPTLASMPAEFAPHVRLQTALAEGAMEALNQGQPERHDTLVLAAAERLLAQGCKAIALAQFSMARAQGLLQARLGVPVLSTPHSAVRALRQRLLGAAVPQH